MLVVAVNDDLAFFCDMVIQELDSLLAAQGGKTDVTSDQFRRYVATAIRVRIEHVDRSLYKSHGNQNTGLTVERGWALPVNVHDLLSGIGNVSLDDGITTIRPVWDRAGNDLLMDESERNLVTRNLKAAFKGLGITYQEDISRDQDGRHSVMVLTFLPGAGEWQSRTPIDREGAKSSLLLGIRPVTDVVRGRGGADYALVDTDAVATALRQLPFWVPEWRMQHAVVVRYLRETAALAG